jgi:hypothetical protein
MKTGIIIYVAGIELKGGLQHNPKDLAKKFGIEADRYELITKTSGHFDIHDAWWQMIAKGMHRVLCVMAEIGNDGDLRLTGRQMRLCG